MASTILNHLVVVEVKKIEKKIKLSQLQPPATLIRNSFDCILLSMLLRACLFIIVLCHARSRR